MAAFLQVLSLFGRPDRPFLVPAKTASAVERSRGPGRPLGRRAARASLDGDEHGRKLSLGGTNARTPRAKRATTLDLVILLSAALAVCEPVLAAPGGSREPQIAAVIQEASARFGLPETWVRAVIEAESGGGQGAVSAKGAMGLMQLMPPTWSQMRAELNLGPDPFDRRDNVLAGTAYLRRLYDRFGPRGFLAAYNAGPARYADHLAGSRPLPTETLIYAARVRRRIDAEPVGQVSAPAISDWRSAPLFVASTPLAGQGPAASSLFASTGGYRP